MKIGILTFHFAHNYGAMLQAYALYQYLLREHYEVEIIDYRPQQISRQYQMGFSSYKIYKVPKKLLCDLTRRMQYPLFEEFLKNYLKCKNQINKEDLKNVTQSYDAVIVGSDQVWNCDINFNDSTYFLDFVGNSTIKKIGYSISFGKSNMTDKLARNISLYLEEFNSISFREKTASSLIKQYTGIQSPVTVDPVFLLNKEIWTKIEKKPKSFNENKYVLYYSLNQDEKLDYLTKNIAKEKGIRVVSIHPLCKNNGVGDIFLNDVGPCEFLWLINHAAYVASNSFHATAFSIIFNKVAIIKPHKQLGIRNRDLLELLGYSLSHIESKSVFDFSHSNKTDLYNSVEFSRKYLNNLSTNQKVGKIKYDEYPKVYAARSKDDDTVLKSSSGGMFTVLYKNFIKQGGVVAAASYNYEKHCVSYIVSDDEKELQLCRGSKYIQSKLGDTFKVIIEKLKEGKKVFFIGTACQVSGLARICDVCGVSKDNLLLCDIVCHGVPSPGLWRTYIKNQEKTIGLIDYISFRDKRIGWSQPTSIVKSGSTEKSIKAFTDMFYSDMFIRKSCYECPYSGIKKPSDITLGDFWGIEQVLPAFFSRNGNSLVILHNPKGVDAFNSIKNDIFFEKSNTLACCQKNLLEPTGIPDKREVMWNFYFKNGVTKLEKTFFPQNKFRKVVYKVQKKLKVHMF